MRDRHIAMRIAVEIYREDVASSNVYGEKQVVLLAKEECGVLRLFERVAGSSVRADAAASKTRAELDTVSGRFIFNAKTQVRADDKIIVSGVEMRVTGLFRRFGLRGRQGNVEVEATAW